MLERSARSREAAAAFRHEASPAPAAKDGEAFTGSVLAMPAHGGAKAAQQELQSRCRKRETGCENGANRLALRVLKGRDSGLFAPKRAIGSEPLTRAWLPPGSRYLRRALDELSMGSWQLRGIVGDGVGLP